MTRRDWWARHRALVGYLVLSVAVVGGFVSAEDARGTAKRQVCQALREDRVLLRDVVNVALPPQTAKVPELDPALPPSVRVLIEQSRARSAQVRADIEARLSRPLELCVGTGVDVRIDLSAGRFSVTTIERLPG